MWLKSLRFSSCSLMREGDWGRLCVYLWECSLLAGRAPSRCHPSWRAGLARGGGGGGAVHYIFENRTCTEAKLRKLLWKKTWIQTSCSETLTLCEDLEVFDRRGASFLLIRDYCGQVLKNKRPSKTQWKNSVTHTRRCQLLPNIFSLNSILH